LFTHSSGPSSLFLISPLFSTFNLLSTLMMEAAGSSKTLVNDLPDHTALHHRRHSSS
jgi:hypothetical protein